MSKTAKFQRVLKTTTQLGLALVLCALSTGAQGTPLGEHQLGTPTQPKFPWQRSTLPKTAKFRKLDTVIGPHINMNVVPFSPVAVHPSGNFVGVVNTHANLVRIFNSVDPNPANWTMLSSLRTAWGPVSCAFYTPPGCPPGILVTCSNSDALLFMDFGGRVKGLLGLPGEPSDLLVDRTRNTAWVSCMGFDVVVEIDLLTRTIRAEYPIPSKHPAFLAFEAGATGSVIVSPMLSGNNTTVDRGPANFNAGPLGILDLSTATQGLPDEDLFRLDPVTASIEPVVVGAGTVLYDHGKNPVSGEWWMLGTDAKNFTLQSEPEANAIFSENRLTIVGALPAPGNLPVGPNRIVNLDDSNLALPGVQINPAITVGSPYALTFDTAGNGFLTGMLTDNVTEYDVTGTFVREWNVGSIPRGLQMITKGANQYLMVYCWGSNQVEIYLPAVGTGIVATLMAGPDPTPPLVKAGRALYYSAAHSQDNNMSCNTCHVDGFSDLLAWDLSDRRKDSSGAYTVTVDDKGPLVTQTLRSIKGQNPYHWRGERGDLIDFNGAFPGLLGGAPLNVAPGGDFDKFEAFVMSLQERANPYESVKRVIMDSLVPSFFPAGTSAVRGQDLFYDPVSVLNFACQDCHTLPSGTMNASFRDEFFAPNVGRSHFTVAPLISFWRKTQKTKVGVEYGGGTTDTLPVLGVGLSATGLADDLQDFLLQAEFSLGLQERHDVAAFLLQLDTGIPPLLHKGVRVGFGSSCPPPAPLTAQPQATPRSSSGIAPPGHSRQPVLATPSTPPASTSLSVQVPATKLADSVQPFLAPNIADEQTANSVAIEILLDDSKPSDLQLVVVGELASIPVQGFYDPDAKTFGLSDGVATPFNLDNTQFLQAYNSGDLVGMIFPMPLGLGERFLALDPDDGSPAVIVGPGPTTVDPLDALSVQAPVVDPVQLRQPSLSDQRGGILPPKQESGAPPTVTRFKIVYATSRVAKLVFTTNVPTRTITEYTPQGEPTRQQVNSHYVKAHMVFLRDLDPSKVWDLNIIVEDAALNTNTYTLNDAFTSMDLLKPNHVKSNSLSARTPDQDSGGSLRFTVDINVLELDDDIATNYTPVFDVLVYDISTDSWRTDQAAVAAPLTDTLGDSFIEFIVSGLAVNDLVMVNLADLQKMGDSSYRWSLPDTRTAARSVTVPYTGTGL